MELENRGLSKRKRQILKAIVDAHIQDGGPVGSKYILQSQQLGCSAATIRNEMAELEEMGYLEQPHASAGRIPSELGYRFYVDSLIEHYVMTTNEIAQINHLLRSKMGELDQILTAASNLASNLTNYTGIAIKPRVSAVSISKFETIYLDPNHYILIAVTSTGAVKSKHLHPITPVSQDAVALLADVLNDCVSTRLADQITLPIIMEMESRMGVDSGLVGSVMKEIYNLLAELDEGEMKVSGINRLLQYPEYSNVEHLQDLLGTLENKEDILNLVAQGSNEDVNVVIGSESRVKVMNNSALVFKPIVKDGHTVGAIGVIGPLRMDYAKVLATLEGLSGNISDMIHTNKQLNGGTRDAGNEKD
ncbi:MAG: heat-inducible transcription repressor HrcA [Clostridia bacterium]|nr:heat-inducible transcription repressor HrcA [Clostridia bacterium]MBR2926477.1 heat-inducible transcription repressor HrcA [Clostridia bacterium]